MKERIKQLMESTHLNQQGFANFLGVSPATINGILKDRSKPTLNIVEAIKNKFPGLSLDWLLYGNGDMYVGESKPTFTPTSLTAPESTSLSGDSDSFKSDSNPHPSLNFSDPDDSVKDTIKKTEKLVTKIIDKKQRIITEIRVFYDDQTWESFVPKK